MLKTVKIPPLVYEYNNQILDVINNDFSVTINGQKVDCFMARCSKVPFNKLYTGVQRNLNQTEILGFVSFEADEQVVVEVESVKEFSRAIVRPLSKGVETKIVDKKVIFTLKEKGQYSLELDDEHNALEIFFNEIASFGKKEEYTYYFGPGYHLPVAINLKSGDKVYIDSDAYVFATIFAKDAEDVVIEGHGVFSGSFVQRSPGLSDGFYNRGNLMMHNCKNVKVNGPIFMDSPFWAVSFFNCENIDIANVKITGQWRYNTDGIDLVSTNNVKVANSYIHCFDDGLVVKAYSQYEKSTNHVIENILIENCIFWCGWGRTCELGIETCAKEMKNVRYFNCDLIHNSHVAMSLRNGNCALVHDFVFENINVEFQKSTMPEVFQKADDQEYPSYGVTHMPYLIRIVNHKFAPKKDGKYYQPYDVRAFDYAEKHFGNGDIYGMIQDITFKGINIYAEEGLPKFMIEIQTFDKNVNFKNISINEVAVNGKKADINDFDVCIKSKIENLKLF